MIAGARIAWALVIARCSFSAPGYDGTHYRCGADGVCPPGFVCVGFDCVVPGRDAPPPPIDAAVVADAVWNEKTVVFGETPGADVNNVTSDTDVNEAQPTFNYGVNADITTRLQTTKHWNGLIRFDLHAIPDGSVITAATLRLHSVPTTPAQTATVELHQILEAWDEGTFDTSPGASSWLVRVSGSGWKTLGAMPPQSSDPSVLAQIISTGPNQAHDVILPASLVQTWAGSSTTNFGLVLVPVTNTSGLVEFYSHEASQVDLRPTLAVTYH